MEKNLNPIKNTTVNNKKTKKHKTLKTVQLLLPKLANTSSSFEIVFEETLFSGRVFSPSHKI